MIFIFISYLVIGGVLCYLFKADSKGHFEDGYFDYSTMLAVVTGVFWPIVSPFTFAILLAKKKGRK